MKYVFEFTRGGRGCGSSHRCSIVQSNRLLLLWSWFCRWDEGGYRAFRLASVVLAVGCDVGDAVGLVAWSSSLMAEDRCIVEVWMVLKV